MNRFCSIFSQLLQLFSRIEFQQAVNETRAERHARGFTCWGQFVAMLFCQLGRAHSLREITGGLRSCEGKLKHLGIPAPSRSTLAYANEHRPWQLYEKIFLQLLQRCRMQGGGRKKFRFKNKLVSLDATTIDLCVTMFDWARFRRTKGAIKLHLLLDHDGYLPEFAVITEGKVADVKMVPAFSFAPGTIVVDDRAYNDYALFGRWTGQGVYFVTRMKDNTLYAVVEERKVPQHRHVLKDQLIQLTGRGAFERCPYLLRRIEIFFKALKQNLKIKTFVGTSANAVKIQIWIALIAMLILRFLQLRSQFGWSLSNLVALLRMNLFTHRDLWTWLNHPFETAPVPYEPEQLRMALA